MTDQKQLHFAFSQTSRKFFLLAALFISFAHVGLAQLKVVHLSQTDQTIGVRENNSARTQVLDPMSLPFLDDFSQPLIKNQTALYPDVNRWENSFSVWVNPGLAIQAPTVNVATFDGLDSAGAAYNSTDIFLNGFTDSLQSRRINLTPSATNPVNDADKSTVYLSFFYQWTGNGEPPDGTDYLQLQFKDSGGHWVTQLTIEPDETMTPNTFYTKILPVTGDQFFHENFQFRFRSFGRLSGPYDTWNVDYVYLNKGRNVNDLSFPDRAAASGLSPLFNPYWAVPYYHFLNRPRVEAVRYDVQNLKDFISSTNYSITLDAIHYVNNAITSTYSEVLNPSKGVKPDGPLFPFERANVQITDLPDVTDPAIFNPAADSIDLRLNVEVISADETDTGKDDFLPYDLRMNDTISGTYKLRNFYAYDDGVAEYAAGLIASGNVVAYEFELPIGLNDTLKILEGFEMYFPAFGQTANQTVDFLIFQEGENDKPRGEGMLVIPSRTIQNKGLNVFQRFKFFPAVQIEGSKFYIGWRQPISGNVLVGLDNSNDTGNRMFVNIEGSTVPREEHWQLNTTVNGSLMIRPIFGTGEVDGTTGIDEEPDFAIYPNPTRGTFFIDGTVHQLEMMSVTGQRISSEIQHENGKTRIEIQSAAPGLYILKYLQGKVSKTHKIILSQ
jgi:hypothetical protein